MRKLFGSLLCCFIPVSALRHAVRNRFNVRAGKTQNSGGKHNKIILVKNGKERCVHALSGCEIYFRGDNNTVKIYSPLNRLHLQVKMYGNSELLIHTSKFLDRRVKILGMSNSKVFVGADLFTNAECLMDCADGADIHIGKDCIFSDFVELRTGDGHTILNTNGEKINFNKSIYIGNHVWLGKYVMVLKGAGVSDNSVVGAHSVVTKKFDDKGVVIVGMPAKIIKTGVNWRM